MNKDVVQWTAVGQGSQAWSLEPSSVTKPVCLDACHFTRVLRFLLGGNICFINIAGSTLGTSKDGIVTYKKYLLTISVCQNYMKCWEFSSGQNIKRVYTINIDIEPGRVGTQDEIYNYNLQQPLWMEGASLESIYSSGTELFWPWSRWKRLWDE